MKENKKTVVYARTASNKQNIDLQLDAAKPFLKEVLQEDVVIITEIATSGLSQQKGLQKVLELVKTNQVDTLLVYQSDRLTRNMNDYLEIINSIYAHKVKVIFTASEDTSFQHDQESGPLMEFIYLLVNEQERIHMSNRMKAF
jgi:site-specific DNA recombinase